MWKMNEPVDSKDVCIAIPLDQYNKMIDTLNRQARIIELMQKENKDAQDDC
jgi:hypothetical protein